MNNIISKIEKEIRACNGYINFLSGIMKENVLVLNDLKKKTFTDAESEKSIEKKIMIWNLENKKMEEKLFYLFTEKSVFEKVLKMMKENENESIIN